MKGYKEPFIELLRLAACFLVIVYHSRYQVYDYVSVGGEISLINRLSLNASFCLGRLAVPLFFIISGYVSFSIKGDTLLFLKKRISRIAIPLLFWLFIYTLILSSPKSFFHDFISLSQTPHLWFLLALLGFVLIQPIISPFFTEAPSKICLLYLFLWGITLVLNGNYFSGIEFNTNHQGLLYTSFSGIIFPFYGYSGYFLLGYLFRRESLSRWFSIVLLVSGVVLLLVYSFLFHLTIDSSLAYCSLPNCFISCSVFLFVKQWYHINCDHINSIICSLGSLTYGVYLIHWLIMRILYSFYPNLVSLNNIAFSFLVFFFSLSIIAILRKIPWVNAIV